MRRGHPGIGGWRNENTRYFRPRSGGTPHFRPPRGFGQLEPPRFPPPGIRLRANSPAPFNSRSAALIGNNGSGYHGRMKFRVDNRPHVQRPSDRGHHKERGNYPVFHRMRMNENPNYPNQFQENRFDKDIEIEPCRVNSMGDVDHRQLLISKDQESYSQNQHQYQASPWASHKDKQSYYDNRTHNSKPYQHDNVDSHKLPIQDYIGHRPPASDHYGGNPGSAVDSANSFSRSVDDTVDIVRKRLLNRDTHQHSTDQIVDRPEDQGVSNPESSNYQNTQDLPTKKRTQRQRISNIKTNCDKIKNNIVHQLFKMDKDKIHKLMDNPNSSTKFEYAISSLITESQNSLNKHLRSVAEQSLTTSSDFIHNDNNTIYEDTFMKQMQCILDPQDTVFLEDIKPLVMAELSKALQVDDYYTHQYDAPDLQDNYYYRRGDTQGLEHGSRTPYDYDNYVNELYFEGNESPHNYENKEYSQIPVKISEDFKFDPGDYIERSIFERRKARISRDQDNERQICIDQRRLSRMSVDETNDLRFATSDKNSTLSRRSTDGKSHEETPLTSETNVPLFDTYGELLSDDEDPFAGLDQQYHVAVDPNFIQTADSSPQPSFMNNESPIKKEVLTNFQTPEKNSNNIIEDQSPNVSKSVLNVTQNEQISNTIPKIQIDQEISKLPLIQPSANNIVLETNTSKQDQNPQNKEAVKPVANSENLCSAVKSSTPDTRKRSQDQRPSHRKEKRKKSESDSNQQILNKNIIINVNDCAAKELEKCTETAKSIFNLYFSKDEHSKEPSNTSSKTESIEKSYSDKYVKRKEQPVTSKEKKTETKRRHRSTSSSHSMVSPKDNSNKSSSSSSNQNIKTDQAKTKLTDINIFMEQPRKVSNVHQAHRNSAVTVKTPEKAIGESQKIHTSLKIVKPICIKKVLSKKTQTKFNEKKKNTTRFTQTNKKKFISKLIQTDPVVFAKSGPKATEAFERMKEIDLEIQVLLQEKFKIYSSLESKNPCPNTMQTLGMTVLNVSQFEDDVPEAETGSTDMTEDSIVAEFTNIPVEELEQIALESVQTLKIESAAEPRKVDKKQRHQKASDRRSISSVSPISKARKTKAPNISLLEQIITDDRPIEDIISLDDLESPPVIKSLQKQASKSKPKKNRNRKPRASKSVCNMDYKLKQCYVLLNRNDFNDYFRQKAVKLSACDDIVIVDNVIEPIVIHSEESNDGKPEINTVGRLEVAVDTNLEESVQSNPERNVEQQIVMEETVMNDIHFDMLDVSEDIVIGDVCEVKSSGDKDVNERMEVPVCEEIILDNSQSSMEEGVIVETSLADNQCKMYDYSTDENLRRDTVTITGNADAVLAIECIENNFLAACLDGNVYYFSGDGQLLTMLRGSNLAVTCLTIVKEKYGTTVYTGSLDSRIRYYDLETGLEKGPECNVLSPIQTMDRAWDTVFVGTRTGFVLQFECKNNMLIPVSTVKFSEQSILALRALKEGPRKVLLVAARSEDVTIKDAQTGLLLRTLFGPKMTVYTLLYEDGKVFCGTSSHQIHVFDYASGSHNGVHEGGKGAVCLRATGGLLFAGCYDGCVYVYREGEPRPLAQLRGPSVMLLSLAVVGSKIIAGYKDRGLYIWKIPLAILQEMIL